MTDIPKLKTVAMEALKDSSYDGVPFQTGDIIEVDPQYVETIEYAGLAARVDRAERATKGRPRRKPAEPAEPQ